MIVLEKKKTLIALKDTKIVIFLSTAAFVVALAAVLHLTNTLIALPLTKGG